MLKGMKLVEEEQVKVGLRKGNVWNKGGLKGTKQVEEQHIKVGLRNNT